MLALTKRRNSSQVGLCLHLQVLIKAFERALKIAPNAVAQAAAFTFAAYRAVTVFQRLFVRDSGFAVPTHACVGRPPTHHKLDILPRAPQDMRALVPYVSRRRLIEMGDALFDKLLQLGRVPLAKCLPSHTRFEDQVSTPQPCQ